MRRSTLVSLTVPSFAELAICISGFIYPNGFVFLLFPLIFIAFVLLIVAIVVASKYHDRTPRAPWTVFGLAGAAQMATLLMLGAFK